MSLTADHYTTAKNLCADRLWDASAFTSGGNLARLELCSRGEIALNFHRSSGPAGNPRIFYGWYIVAVGFLSHVACAFHMSSTLSVFLRPLTEDLGVSRGVFSLLRSGEILIGAVMAPLVGPLVDRFGENARATP